MKKIFAIALAVVMVFSMASAFALNACTNPNFSWDCLTEYDNCGKGSVEVVPYVKVNGSCDTVTWQVSDCATAINTENVFYAVKLTVEAHADDLWWEMTNGIANDNWGLVDMSYDGVAAAEDFLAVPATVWADDDEAHVFYYNFNTGNWVDEEDDAFSMGGAYIKQVRVTEADEAEVCAKLASEHNGTETLWSFGDYFVWVDVNEDGLDYVITFADAAVFAEADNLIEVYVLDGEVIDVYTAEATKAFYNGVNATFNLDSCVIGTCINADNIKANFGWDDEQEDCFKWSDKGAAVVDTDCVVAIPKTGDASVLAWLF